jgi:hypothetical protein
MEEGSCLAFSSVETIGCDISLDQLNIHQIYPTHCFQHLMDKIHFLLSCVKVFSKGKKAPVIGYFGMVDLFSLFFLKQPVSKSCNTCFTKMNRSYIDKVHSAASFLPRSKDSRITFLSALICPASMALP